MYRTMHNVGIDEVTVPLFTIGLEDGKPSKNNKYIIGARNYVAVEVQESGDQVWDLRVEMTRGGGEHICRWLRGSLLIEYLGKTRSYPVVAPRAAY